MRPTFKLGRVFDIPIGLHWSVALVAGLITLTLTGTILPAAVPGQSGLLYLATGLATAALFLGSILAHELGHSVVAQNNGVGVKNINLFALGGVAVLESEPPSAGAAGRIALAGPAVSVAVGLGSLAAAVATSAIGLPALMTSALNWLGVINLALAVFNMLPALPLDGGRVLQAVLWSRSGNRHQATISAARLGRYLGWAMVGFGLWQLTIGGTGLWTAMIGWFVVSSARAEGRHAKRQAKAAERASEAQTIGGLSFADLLASVQPPTSSSRRGPVIDVEGRPRYD